MSSPAYAPGGSSDATPDAGAVHAEGVRQRRVANAAAADEHKGKGVAELQQELEKKRALLADMKKWNNRLNVVLAVVIVPFAALVCKCGSLQLACGCGPSHDVGGATVFSLFKTQILEWCAAGPPVFFPRMFPGTCDWLQNHFSEEVEEIKKKLAHHQ